MSDSIIKSILVENPLQALEVQSFYKLGRNYLVEIKGTANMSLIALLHLFLRIRMSGSFLLCLVLGSFISLSGFFVYVESFALALEAL